MEKSEENREKIRFVKKQFLKKIRIRRKFQENGSLTHDALPSGCERNKEGEKKTPPQGQRLPTGQHRPLVQKAKYPQAQRERKKACDECHGVAKRCEEKKGVIDSIEDGSSRT